jgi:HEAT repeat protein
MDLVQLSFCGIVGAPDPVGGEVFEGGLIMSRPRRRLFGPLFYSTLVVAGLVGIYATILYGPELLGQAERMFNEWREVAALAEALRVEDPVVREHAAKRLMTKGIEVSMPILREAVRDPRGEVRALALRSMSAGGGGPSQLFPALIAAATDGHELVRLEAARGLGGLARSQAVLKGLRSPSGAPGGLTSAQRDDSIRTLRRLLKDPWSLIRAEAAGALVEFGPDPSVSADLAAVASDHDRTVRLAAARSLLKVNGPGDRTAAGALIAILADPGPVPDRPEILQVIMGLSDAVQEQAVAALVGLLSGGDPAVVPDVLACLPMAGPRAKAALPALEAMLEHAEPTLRAGAGMAIVAIEGGEDFQSLVNGNSGGMSMAMMGGGGAGMGGAGGMSPMNGGAGMAPPATGGKANPRVVAVLVRILGDAEVSPEMRANAFGMTQEVAPAALAKATPDLVRQLADPDPKVRRTALDLLSMIIDDTPVELPAVSGAR